MKHLIYTLAVLVLALSVTAFSQVPNKISYQGLLTTSAGTPVQDGNYDLTFKIFDAASGGTELWTETHSAVPVARGTFSVILGTGITALPDIFNQALYVEVTGTGPGIPAPITFSPRSELTSAPYSLSLKVPVILTASSYDEAIIKAVNLSDGLGLRGESYGSTGALSIGVMGKGEASGIGDAYGLTGYASGSSSGNVYGVTGYGLSTSSGGVYGGYFSTFLSGTGARYGSYSEAFSNTGASTVGTFGWAENRSTGDARGGFFVTSPSNRGTGTRYGIVAKAFSSTPYPGYTYGVKGESYNNSSGDSYGGYFTSWAEHGSTSFNVGSYSEGTSIGNKSALGCLGRGVNSELGMAKGGYFHTYDLPFGTGNKYGVDAAAYAGGAGVAYGVKGYGENTSIGTVYGGYFETNSGGTGSHYGIYAIGDGSSSALTYGAKVVGKNNSSGITYAGHYETDMSVRGTGTKVGLLGAAYGNNSTVSGAQGISGMAENLGSGPAVGGFFYAYSAGTGIKYGIYAEAPTSPAGSRAGHFVGNVHITGTLSKGAGTFQIDHPLDPENKYLIHSFVESPDMMNIYNGNVVLDSRGEAVVELPKYFDALNKDFRYQLTCIGGYANVYIAEKINTNSFKIAGGTPGLEVSWQVTGVRKDKYAEANRVQVEVDKRPDERGKYLHPEVFGLGEEKSMHYEMHQERLAERKRMLEEEIKHNAEREASNKEMKEQLQREAEQRKLMRIEDK